MTGTFFVSCYWKDERINWKSGYKLKSPHYVLHQNLASKFWSPRMRVGRYYPMKTPFIWISHQIQHVKKSNNDAGRLYFQERFSLNNVSGVPLVDLDMMTRVEITCPMNFNWFPFDSQVCKIALPSQYLLIFFELTNTVSVSDNKIQITILILRRNAINSIPNS